ncbi:MAG: hypothetical protein A2W07_07345 [candidate division Zixibacteria bacterium RBG_16_43_9]|nr:MAG: hypothetical protein A2W07_07345 [candidate division Zixibacteria bacterium RBG_16_43_9]
MRIVKKIVIVGTLECKPSGLPDITLMVGLLTNHLIFVQMDEEQGRKGKKSIFWRDLGVYPLQADRFTIDKAKVFARILWTRP